MPRSDVAEAIQALQRVQRARWRGASGSQLAITLFLSLTVVPALIGKLVIPLEWYAFRCWEVMVDQRPAGARPGWWYPNQVLQKLEHDDLVPRTRYSKPRNVVWYTDAYGYRNRPRPGNEPIDIVVIGDSEIVGSSMTQDDILSEVLERMTGRPVYAYAPAYFGKFVEDPRFQQRPPKVVVFSFMERSVAWRLVPLGVPYPGRVRVGGPPNPYRLLPARAQIAWDKIRKKPFLVSHLIRRITGRHPLGLSVIKSNQSDMFFFRDDLAAIGYHQQHPEDIDRTVRVIRQYHHAMAMRGVQFLFVGNPSKEIVYWDLVPPEYRRGLRPPDFFTQLLPKLEAAGVPTLDLRQVYREAGVPQGELVFHLGNTHWNPHGVRLAAKAIAERLTPWLE
ncbi:MAG: hypothetical protein HY737_07500 [Candidatus Omnitrophica bacterium]|nr:hypothetical protein [Candidatus Omnitrophota bacterium]